MTPDEEAAKEDVALEERATKSRTRLLETLDALERRGTHLVATVHQVKNLAALAIDGVAVLGAVASLLALIRSTERAVTSPAPARRPGRILSRLAVFALFAGAAYVARRGSVTSRTRSVSRAPGARLRAV
jgi:hypothetical protein